MSGLEASAPQLSYQEQHAHHRKFLSILLPGLASVLFAYLMVGLRFVARSWCNLRIRCDDWMLVIVVVCMTGYMISYDVGTIYGLGKHSNAVGNIRSLSKTLVAMQVCYDVMTICIKVSFLWYYGTLFPLQWMLRALKLLAAFIMVNTIVLIIFNTLMCHSVGLDLHTTHSARCLSFGPYAVPGSIVYIAANFVILALPIPALWSLNMSLNKRLHMIAIFLTGFFACALGIVRLVYVIRVDLNDLSSTIVDAATLSLVESAVGVSCACFPTFRVFCTRGLQRFKKNSTASSSQDSSEIWRTQAQSKSARMTWQENSNRDITLHREVLTLGDQDRR